MSAELHILKSRTDIGKATDLLHALVPRAQGFCFYDFTRQCIWASDSPDDSEIDSFVARLPEELVSGPEFDATYQRRTLPSGRTLLVLPVSNNQLQGTGLLVAVFSRNAGKSSWFNPQMLCELLTPVANSIGETIGLNDQLALLTQRCEQVDEELKLVYSVDEKIHGTTRSHAGLAQLVGHSGRFLGIGYSALLIPGKRIRVSATHSSWKNVNRKALDRYLIEHLMPRLEERRNPIVFEIPPVDGGDKIAGQGYQALLCPLTDKHGNVEGVMAQLGRINKGPFNSSDRRFMTHIVRKIEYVIEQSFDSMTGLMNRSGFEEQIHESMQTLDNDEATHQIIYFDLDNLQLVNDTFGRKAGDAVIVRFARLLEEDLPKSAVLSRLTADDFCILLTKADVDSALALATTIRNKCSALRYLEGDRSLQVTISVGIAEINCDSEHAGNSLTTARMACEAAKDHGRDRIEVYDERNQSIIRRYDDMQLVAQIQQSLDSDAFDLLAQPIVPLRGGALATRYEILLRMNDKKGVPVPSKALFSAAERYQMMPQIDRWVLSTSIAQIAEFIEFSGVHGAVFAINLSGQSLGDNDILDFIEQEIRDSGVPASALCFEITESAAVSNFTKAQEFIDALRAKGCKIALDDFGAGLSSFAYLKNFKVDTLKIDGGFIRDISENRISESMVAAITQVAKVMELETVAEYVESQASRKLVAELGVDFAQGHAVGHPAPLEGVLRALSGVAESSMG